MRNILVVALLLVAVRLPLFPETYTCEQSLELGKYDATMLYKSWPWFLVGIGTGFLAFRTLTMITAAQASSQSYENPGTNALWLAFGLVIALPYIPASALFPFRATAYPMKEGLDLDCYQKGYIRKARLKNCGSLLLGETVAFGGLLLLAFNIAENME